MLLDIDFAGARRHEADAFSFSDAAANVGRGEVDARHRDDLNAVKDGVTELFAQGLQIGHRTVAAVDGHDCRQLGDAGWISPERQIGQRVGTD